MPRTFSGITAKGHVLRLNLIYPWMLLVTLKSWMCTQMPQTDQEHKKNDKTRDNQKITVTVCQGWATVNDMTDMTCQKGNILGQLNNRFLNRAGDISHFPFNFP